MLSLNFSSELILIIYLSEPFSWLLTAEYFLPTKLSTTAPLQAFVAVVSWTPPWLPLIKPKQLVATRTAPIPTNTTREISAAIKVTFLFSLFFFSSFCCLLGSDKLAVLLISSWIAWAVGATESWLLSSSKSAILSFLSTCKPFAKAVKAMIVLLKDYRVKLPMQFQTDQKQLQ